MVVVKGTPCCSTVSRYRCNTHAMRRRSELSATVTSLSFAARILTSALDATGNLAEMCAEGNLCDTRRRVSRRTRCQLNGKAV